MPLANKLFYVFLGKMRKFAASSIVSANMRNKNPQILLKIATSYLPFVFYKRITDEFPIKLSIALCFVWIASCCVYLACLLLIALFIPKSKASFHCIILSGDAMVCYSELIFLPLKCYLACNIMQPIFCMQRNGTEILFLCLWHFLYILLISKDLQPPKPWLV